MIIKMQKAKDKKLLRLSILVLVLSLVVSSFVCCTFSSEMPPKEDISSSIDSVINDPQKDYQYVHIYLRDFGISNFDSSKFLWVEMRFQAYFNLISGMPEVAEHARLTALDFIDQYYDKVDLTDKNAVTDALITCYVNAIGDKYSIYRTPVEHESYDSTMSGTFGGIGVVIDYDHVNETLLVSTVYIDSPAEVAGIQPGDYIVAVDGKTVEEVGYLNVVNYVRGEVGTNVTVTVKRGDTTLDVVATRAQIEEKTVAYSVSDDGIGYVQIVEFKENTYAQFVQAIDALEQQKVKGIIFDLRGNPGGYVDTVCHMVSYLIPSGYTIVTYQYKGLTANGIKSEDDVHPTTQEVSDHVVDLPMVVICDEYTASAGELFTAAIRDYDEMGILKGTIVGQRTFGKGIMQSSWVYYDASSITMTVAYYNPPCGQNYHGSGVLPDRVVLNELQDDYIIDKQLEAAVEELNSLIISN